jgi:hypothetical protein
MISLWMCKNAIYYENDYIMCAKGHTLPRVHSRMVKKGNRLVCMVCQGCKDADIMGADLEKEDRGWGYFRWK